MTLCLCRYWKLARVLLCLCMTMALLIGLHSYYFGGVLILPLCTPISDFTSPAHSSALQWDHNLEECSRGGDLGCFHNCARSTSITSHEKELLLYTLERVTQLLESHNITYFLCYGSLLGMRRHGGLIPWDDDVDLCLLAEDEIRVTKLVDAEERKFKTSTGSSPQSDMSTKVQWRQAPLRQTKYVVRKVFLDLPTCHRPVPNFCWPFIDLLFISTIYSQYSFGFHTFVPLEQIYPLRREYFDGVPIWTPHKDDVFLSDDMMTQCCTRSFNHKFETFRICTVCVPCERVARCVRNYNSTIPSL